MHYALPPSSVLNVWYLPTFFSIGLCHPSIGLYGCDNISFIPVGAPVAVLFSYLFFVYDIAGGFLVYIWAHSEQGNMMSLPTHWCSQSP